MQKTHIIIIAGVLAILMILTFSNIFSMISLFLIAGIVPGTDYSVAPGIMLIGYGITIWLVFCQRTAQYYLRRMLTKDSLQKLATRVTMRSLRRRVEQS